jgi:hypothetical protein
LCYTPNSCLVYTLVQSCVHPCQSCVHPCPVLCTPLLSVLCTPLSSLVYTLVQSCVHPCRSLVYTLVQSCVHPCPSLVYTLVAVLCTPLSREDIEGCELKGNKCGALYISLCYSELVHLTTKISIFVYYLVI